MQMSQVLQERRQALLRQCGEQRAAMRALCGEVVTRLRSADRILAGLGRVLSHPVAVGAGILVVATLGRQRTLSWLAAGAGLVGSATRLGRWLAPGPVSGRHTVAPGIRSTSGDTA